MSKCPNCNINMFCAGETKDGWYQFWCNGCGYEVDLPEEMPDTVTPKCFYCGNRHTDLFHIADERWICPNCNDEIYGGERLNYEY